MKMKTATVLYGGRDSLFCFPEAVQVAVLVCGGHLFEGRYSLTNAHGKREVHTVYAKTKEECEVRLETMIAEVRERIKGEKRHGKRFK